MGKQQKQLKLQSGFRRWLYPDLQILTCNQGERLLHAVQLQVNLLTTTFGYLDLHRGYLTRHKNE